MEAQLRDGTQLTLDDKPLGRGGEGDVYRVRKTGAIKASTVAKLYVDSKRTAQRQQKLQYLAANPPASFHDAGGHAYLSWPQQVLYQAQRFVGFTMPEAVGGSLTIICQPHIDLDLAPQWERFAHGKPGARNLRLTVGLNLCHAIASLQQKQLYVLADLKPANVRLTEKGLVCLIDLDSVQVGRNGQVLFPSAAQTPEYAPPESVQNPANKLPSWDNFSLAVMLYQILLGIHPFQCQPLSPNINGMTAFIAAGLYPHGQQRGAIEAVPKPHYRLSEYPAEVAGLFLRCFDEGLFNPQRRPSAEEWFRTLKQLLEAPATINHFDASTYLAPDLSPICLSWDVTGAVALTLSGVGDVTGQTETWVSVTADTDFILEATSLNGKKVSHTRRVEVNKHPADIAFFTPSQSQLNEGDPIILNWQVSRAVRLRIDGGVGDVSGRSSIQVKPPGTGRVRYVLRAETAFGVVNQAETTVEVFARPKLSGFQPSHGKIKPGQSTTLTWKSQHCARLTLREGMIDRDVTHTTSLTVAPAATTKYTLVAEGHGGLLTLRETTTVEVLPAVEFDFFEPDRPITIQTVPTTLRWRVRHQQRLRLESSGPDLPGGINLLPGQDYYEVSPNVRTIYTLTAHHELDGARPVTTQVEVQPLPRLTRLALPEMPPVRLATPPSLPDLLHLTRHTTGLFPAPSFVDSTVAPAPAAPLVGWLARLRQALFPPAISTHLGPNPSVNV